MASYKVEILDNQLKPLTKIQALIAFDRDKSVLEYSQRLSSWGTCRFRVGTKDPLFTTLGDILIPFKNHVRITRGTTVVWQGVIVNNPHRTHLYVEVEARTYLYMLEKVLINHDAAPDKNYRTFKSGTMATAIQTILTEAKAKMGGVLNNMSLGTIENPQFPSGFTSSTGAALTGDWTFSDTFQLKIDYRTIYYVLSLFGTYASCDFELAQSGNTLTFNWKKYLGNRNTNVVFEFGPTGAIEDYDIPLDGENMANNLTGVAADNSFQILAKTLPDNISIAQYGLIEDVAAFADVKNINLLTQRLVEELRLSSTPDSEIRIRLNDRAYPLGVYAIGDTVNIRIKDKFISLNQNRRVVGIDVKVDSLANESITLQTNKLKEGQ